MSENMSFLLVLWWTATILSILGAYWVAEGKKQGFLVWCISNPLIILQCYLTNSWNLVFLYFVFWILAVRGFMKKPKERKISYQEAMNIVFKPKMDSLSINNKE